MRVRSQVRGFAALRWAGVLGVVTGFGLWFAAAQEFGQNKVTHQKFDWQVTQSPHFEVHHYLIDDTRLREVVAEAEQAYDLIASRLERQLRAPVPLILYRTHAEFEQTNVVLAEIPEAVAGFAEPFQGRVVLPIDAPPEQRRRLIRHELAHIFEFDILFAGSIQRALRGEAPVWLMEGLASWLAQDEGPFDQMVIRDAVANNLIPRINQIVDTTFLNYRYGHAVFAFMADTWGAAGVRRFLDEYRKVLLTGDLDKALREAFGIGAEVFDRRYARYLRKRYLPVLVSKRAAEEYGPEIGLPRPGQFTFSPALSPSGDLVAVLATPGLKIDALILSAKDGKLIRNLTRGYTTRYENIVTGAFEGRRDLTWSPDGDRLAFFVKRENQRPLVFFHAVTGRLIREHVFDSISSCASPAFSPDGRFIAFSGNQDGAWDIFRFDLETGVVENLTGDAAVDSNPAWSPDGRMLYFNRQVDGREKIFALEIGRPDTRHALTGGSSSDIQPLPSRDGRSIYFSSDRGPFGIFNLHRLDLTTQEVTRLTDLDSGAFTPAELAPAADGTPQLTFAAYSEGTFRLHRMKLSGPEVEEAKVVGNTEAAVPPPPVEAEAAPPPAPAPPVTPKGKYRLNWDVDIPNFTVGVADDGSLLSDVSVRFTDLLGNQRIGVRSFTVSDLTNFEFSYLNLTGRWDWGVEVTDYRAFYRSASGEDRRLRYSALTGRMAYPFNRYYRFEAGAGFAHRQMERPVVSLDSPTAVFSEVSDNYPVVELGLVGDTLRYQSFGPYQGQRFRVGAAAYWFTGGDSERGSVTMWHWDWRGYQHLTQRSLFAARFTGVLQRGGDANLLSLGGINELRGYAFREFFGENVLLANLEWRFPLWNDLTWFTGWRTAPVRGFAYIDAGTAWFQDATYAVFDPQTGDMIGIGRGKAAWDPQRGILRRYRTKDDEGRLQDLRASAGLGFSVPVLNLPFTWVFSRTWDGKQFADWRSDFYIVVSW